MGPSPKKIEEYKSEPVQVRPLPKKAEIKKVPNCFVMNTPPKPGMVPVSTDQVKDGCFVMVWQNQQVTMLVSDAHEWYSLAGKMMKAGFVFCSIFALAFLLVLVIRRDRF